MTTKLVDSAGLSEFSSKVKEKTVFIGNSQSGNLGLLDLIYPVGSIYMSVNNVSPQTFIGGTWERIQDTFLLSAGTTYSAGSTGGSATHYHWLPYIDGPENGTIAILNTAALHKRTTGIYPEPEANNWLFRYASDAGTTSNNGQHGTSDGSSMPPYLTVYMWKRIA